MSHPIRPVLLQLRWAVDAARDADFNQWYDDEHMADLRRVPGIALGRRFRRVPSAYGSPTEFNYLTLYEAESLDAFATREYRALAEKPSAWTQRIASALPRAREVVTAQGPLPAKAELGHAIAHVYTQADAGIRALFHAWYDEEHLPLLAAVPGVRSARRYRIVEPADGEFGFVAVYELDDAEIACGDAWMQAGRPTPRRAQLGSGLRSQINLWEEIRRQ